MSFRPCVVIPVYNHERAIAQTVAAVPPALAVYLVDDGSSPQCAAELDRIAKESPRRVKLLRHPRNLGKGAAVHTGIAAARADGFTHAVQVDSDGQHDLADLPRMLALAESDPSAVVTGVPVYDASVPKGRLYGRYLTHLWVWINTLSFEIRDSMCGFRSYPADAFLSVWRDSHVSRRMAFDTDILVRLHWRGTRVLELPTRVTYPQDGVSHFDMFWDNLRISGMHTRLFFGMLLRLPLLLGRRIARLAARVHGTAPA